MLKQFHKKGTIRMSGHSITPMFRSPVTGKIWPGDGSEEDLDGEEPVEFLTQPALLPLPDNELAAEVGEPDNGSIAT